MIISNKNKYLYNLGKECRILLVLGPLEHSIQAGLSADLLGKAFKYPPLGLLHLAAYIRQHRPQWQVRVLDCQAHLKGGNALNYELARYKPHVVGISFFGDSLIANLKTCQTVKRLLPTAVVIAGGPHVLHYPKEIAAKQAVDFVVRGEGEKPLLALLDFVVEGGTGNPDIEGVYFAKADEVAGKGKGLVEEDLDSLPHPDRIMTPFRRYFAIWSRRAFCTASITSRGCPFQCSFCDIPYKTIRFHSPPWVIQDLKNCLDLGIREVHFFDDNFNLDAKRAAEIAFLINKQGLKLDWSFRGRVDCMEPTMLKALHKAGCYRVYLGLESGTDRILKKMNKQITVSDIKKGVAAAKKAGLEVHGYFMLGFEEETREEMEETINLACSLGLEFASFTLATYGPGMKMYNRALENGIFGGDPWLDYTKNPYPDFAPPVPASFTIGQEEGWRTVSLALRRFYLRPGVIWRTGKSIRSPQAFIRRAWGGMRALQFAAQSFNKPGQ